MATRPEPIARAYAACEALARSHYENFPVASRLLPSRMRPHVAAVYAFARVADDLADEGDVASDVRQRRLGEWQRQLHEAVGSTARTGETVGDDLHALIVRALAHSIERLDLPVSLFDDLVSAFSQDITTKRYDSWLDLYDYCRRSANPVGRLVLRIAGFRDERLDRSSDALCTALQLTNFWQDIDRDFRTGRIYVPREVRQGSGADEADLAANRPTAAWTQALDACVTVTRERFAEGRAVCDLVGGRLGLELRLTWLGGMRVLERVKRRARGQLAERPTLGVRDLPGLIGRALLWRAAT